MQTWGQDTAGAGPAEEQQGAHVKAERGDKETMIITGVSAAGFPGRPFTT